MSISFYFYLFLIAVLSVVVSLGGSRWIERLYRKNKDILTFPDDVVSRGRWRPYLLGIAFLACGVRFFFLTSGLPLVFMLYAAALLLLMTATDFEQYCLFDEMMIPFALGAWCSAPCTGPSSGTISWRPLQAGLFSLLLALCPGVLSEAEISSSLPVLASGWVPMPCLRYP